jgi:hypothetical protein
MASKKPTKVAKKAAKKAAKKVARKAAKKAAKKVARKGGVGDVTPALAEVAMNPAGFERGLANVAIMRAAANDVCSAAGRAQVKSRNKTNGRVSREHVLNRTEAMLFCRFGLVDLRPNAPLPISPADRADLRGPINGQWFDDVQCSITRGELEAAGTLSALVTAIYNACALKI